jgi:hypothetical protein
LWSDALPEALAGSALGAGMMAAAFLLFRRSLTGSHVGFLKAFLAVFGLKALGFLALLVAAWRGGCAALPLLAPYVAVAVGGTVAVALALPVRKGAAHAG